MFSQHHRAGLLGGFGALHAHGHADIGLLERRCIVDAATARPTAAMKLSAPDMPRRRVPNRNNSAAAPRITTVRRRLKTVIFASGGVVPSPTDASMRPLRPISVAAPVATTTARAGLLVHRNRLAGERGFVDTQLARLQQAHVGRKAVARGQQNDVTGHQTCGIDVVLPAVTQHHRARRQQVADCLQCPLGFSFLHETDQGVEQHDRNDDHAVDPMADRHSHHRGHDQHDQQEVVELAGQPHAQPRGRCFRQRVRPVPCLGARHCAQIKAPLRVEFEVAQQLLDRQCVPDRVNVFGLPVGRAVVLPKCFPLALRRQARRRGRAW
jgi:hypothetical protein